MVTFDFIQRILCLSIHLFTLSSIGWLDCYSAIFFNFLPDKLNRFIIFFLFLLPCKRVKLRFVVVILFGFLFLLWLRFGIAATATTSTTTTFRFYSLKNWFESLLNGLWAIFGGVEELRVAGDCHDTSGHLLG